MYEMIRRRVEGAKEGAIRFASELVATPSVTGEEGTIGGKIAHEMERQGFDRVITDECGNVLGLVLGRKTDPALLLCSHMDTVPAGETSPWRRSPFSGEIEDGCLHGLGASDCKAGIAAQIFAAGLLKRANLPLDGSVVVAVTTGEESGDSTGVRALIEQTLPSLDLKPTMAVLGEPTDMGLYYGHDGWAQFEVSITGINQLQVSDAVRAIVDDTRRRHGTNGNGRWALDLEQPRFGERSGYVRADLLISKRTHVGENIESVLKQIEHDAKSVAESVTHTAVAVKVPRMEQRLCGERVVCTEKIVHAWSTDPFHPLVDQSRLALTTAGCDPRPGKWQLPRKGMATAGGLLSKTYGIPTVGYGPGSEREAHAPNESVRIDDVTASIYGTAAIAHKLVGIPVWGWGTNDY